MGYSKKILILNEVTKGFGAGAVKGVAAIEQIGQSAKCAVNIFNLKDVSKGLLLASLRTTVYAKAWPKANKRCDVIGRNRFGGNLYCVLCYISDENIIPIAWGANNAKLGDQYLGRV